jgi:hypothetical protein
MIQDTEGAKKLMELCRRVATKRGLVLQDLSWGIAVGAPHGAESDILTITADTGTTAEVFFTRDEVKAFSPSRSVKTRQKVIRTIEGML